MKEKKNPILSIARKFVRAILLIVTVIFSAILALAFFFYAINPIITEGKLHRYTRLYFQALEEGDIETASQYIGGYDSYQDIEGSPAEWLEKVSVLQESNIVVHYDRGFLSGDHVDCIKITATVTVQCDNKEATFEQEVHTDPPCVNFFTFKRLYIPYYERNDDRELVKDAKFFIASELTR